MHFHLPTNISQRLQAVPRPYADAGSDLQFWPGDTFGQYTVSAAYHLLSEVQDSDTSAVWEKIWKLSVPKRVKCFIWQLVHGRILTNYHKSRMHFGDPFCMKCSGTVETLLHALRDCPNAMYVWLNVVPGLLRNQFFAVNIQQWVMFNLNVLLNNKKMVSWSALWATTCHSLWTWRNKENHDDDFTRPGNAWGKIKVAVLNLSMRSLQEERHLLETNVNS